jgi:tetratricopeptide (TPR) repeat protein
MNKYNYILAEDNCITEMQLLDYIDKKLSTEENYAIETHLIDCDMCSDAVDGLMLQSTEKSKQHLLEINKEIQKKIAHIEEAILLTKPKPSNPIKITSNNKKNWAIAASLLFLLGVGGFSVFSFIKNQEQKNNLAKNEHSDTKNKEVDYAIVDNTNELATITVNPEDLNNSKELPTESKTNETKTASKEESIKIPEGSIVLHSPKFQKDIASSKEENKTRLADNIPAAATNATAVAAVPGTSTSAPTFNNDAFKATNTNDNLALEKTLDKDKIDNNQILKKEPTNLKNNELKNTDGVEENIVSNNGYGMKRGKTKNDVTNTYNSNQMSYPYNTMPTKKESEQEIEDIGYNLHDSKTMHNEGMKYYNRASYNKAIRYFKNALKAEPVYEKEDVMYYLANAYLKVNKQKEATLLFEKLSKGKLYQSEAKQQLMKK